MSGGADEFVSGYDEMGNSNYVAGESYGLNMTKEAKNVNGEYISTKYITKYTNGTGDNNSITKTREVSKIGEGVKEIRRKSDVYGWYGDYLHIVERSYPFHKRGGNYGASRGSGVFFVRNSNDKGNSISFRICLAQ